MTAATGRDRRAARGPSRRLGGGALRWPSSAAVFVWFLPQFTSLAEVWTSVRDMTWVELAVLVLAAAWNLATYQFVMVSTTPGLTAPAGVRLDRDDDGGLQHRGRRCGDLARD